MDPTGKPRALRTLHHEVHRLSLCLCPELRVPLTDPWQMSPSAHDGHHVAWSPEGKAA